MVKRSSRRYARALVELAVEEKRSEETRKELEEITNLLKENEELKKVLFQRVVSSQEKVKILENILANANIHPVAKRFLLHLASQQRFQLFFDIAEEFNKEIDKRLEIIPIEVYAAMPLTPVLQKKIEDGFKTWGRDKIKITYHVDLSLIGGIITKVGTQVFDSSIKSQLSTLGREFERAAL